MTALEYMKLKMKTARENLDKAIHKANAPEHEINNLKQKIGFYREAARALEGVGQNAKQVVISEKYGSSRCPRCNDVVYRSHRYCNQCGQKLDWNIYDKGDEN